MNTNISNNSQSATGMGAILVISPDAEDHAFVRNLFKNPSWQVRGVSSSRQAFEYMSRNDVAVVVCEKELPDCDWKQVLAGLDRTANIPILIVTSESVDDCLWAEVLNLGGYDVLMKPLDSTEVGRVISLAWSNWNHARESASSGLAAAAGM